jgi:hypothetical protein
MSSGWKLKTMRRRGSLMKDATRVWMLLQARMRTIEGTAEIRSPMLSKGTVPSPSKPSLRHFSA